MQKQSIVDPEHRTIETLLSEHDIEFDQQCFRDRVVVITGGSSGIGLQLVKGLLSLGSNVISIDKKNYPEKIHDRLDTINCDLSEIQKLSNELEGIIAKYKNVDGIINCAAEFPFGATEEIPTRKWERTFKVNFNAPLTIIQKLLPVLSDNGYVMNVLALEGLPLAGAYCASKSANRAMLLSLAGEKQGVANIFGFTPGVVCTDLAISVYTQYANATNVTLEEFVKENTQNPGYSLMMPPQHCALAALLAINESKANHGIIAEPFAYLDKVGIIEIPKDNKTINRPAGIINRYLNEIKEAGLYIENKIFERTIKINDEKEKIAFLFNELKSNHSNIEKLNRELQKEIDEKDKYYKMLMRKSQTEALGEVAGNIAHEINNPLMIIRSASQLTQRLMQSDSITKEDIEDKIDKIIETTDRVSDVVKSIKVLSRDSEPEASTEETIDNLIKYVISVTQNNAKRKQINFDHEVEAPEGLTINCKPTQISQVLINLLSNSIDAVKDTKDPSIKLYVNYTGSGIKFTVSNNGSEIPSEIRDKILNPFFTTKEREEGSGLGLSISSKILLEHDSTLDFTSNKDETCFFFTLENINEYRKGA